MAKDVEDLLCVVYYYHKKGRESLVCQVIAKDEFEARRKAGGIFCFLNDRIVHVDVMQSAEVFWKKEKDHEVKYKEYLPMALKFKKEYQKKRNSGRLERGYKKVKKTGKLVSTKRDKKKKGKAIDDQLSFLD